MAALVSVLANIAVNVLSTRTRLLGDDVATITYEYSNLFTPAGYAFAIWGLIYLCFIGYGVASLLPSQQRVPLYDRLSIPFIAANALGSLWLMVFQHRLIAASVLVIVVTLAVAVLLFLRSHEAVDAHRASPWIVVPFALFLGWISVATIANVTILCVSLGWNGAPLTPGTWSMMMVSVAAAIAIAAAVRFREPIVPAVVAWAAFALFVRNRTLDEGAALFAVVAGGVCALTAVAVAVVRARSAFAERRA